jgi:hypothetical protein
MTKNILRQLASNFDRLIARPANGKALQHRAR